MILAEMPTELDDHPLAGLSPEQRDGIRAQAFGRVLAAIALRRTGIETTEEQERIEQSPPQLPLETEPRSKHRRMTREAN